MNHEFDENPNMRRIPIRHEASIESWDEAFWSSVYHNWSGTELVQLCHTASLMDDES